MMEWLHRRRALGLPEDSPLFCWTDGRSFTVNEVRSAVRACMQAAGRDPARFGAHSFEDWSCDGSTGSWRVATVDQADG